jgi:hypothetical protein
MKHYPRDARTTPLLCFEEKCSSMTGRARPCPIHDAQQPRDRRSKMHLRADAPLQHRTFCGVNADSAGVMIPSVEAWNLQPERQCVKCASVRQREAMQEASKAPFCRCIQCHAPAGEICRPDCPSRAAQLKLAE